MPYCILIHYICTKRKKITVHSCKVISLSVSANHHVWNVPIRWQATPRWWEVSPCSWLSRENTSFSVHWENYISISLHIEWDMIVVTVFLSHWMVYDRGDGFPFDFEPNGIPFGSKSKGKLSPRSYTIQYERKWKHSFLSVQPSERLAPIMGGLIEGPPGTPWTSGQCGMEAFMGAPIMQRGVSVQEMNKKWKKMEKKRTKKWTKNKWTKFCSRWTKYQSGLVINKKRVLNWARNRSWIEPPSSHAP